MSWETIRSRLFRRKTHEEIQQDLDGRASHGLVRSLTLFDLTCFGIAAVIGAGIFFDDRLSFFRRWSGDFPVVYHHSDRLFVFSSVLR